MPGNQFPGATATAGSSLYPGQINSAPTFNTYQQAIYPQAPLQTTLNPINQVLPKYKSNEKWILT